MKSIKPIVPKGFNIRLIDQALKGALASEGNIAAQEFAATTATWKHKPAFQESGPGRRGGDLVWKMETRDEIYLYVTGGTEPHPIPKKAGAKVLRFRGGYRPKTMPGKIVSFPGGKFGSVTFRKKVQHPGTEARGFEKEIATGRRKSLPRVVQAFLKRALSR